MVVNPNPSVSNVSLSSTRSSNTQLLMNKRVTAQDSLYFMCKCVKKRLECLPQLQPYLNLAHSSAEILTEHQALLLSQKQQQQIQQQSQSKSQRGSQYEVGSGNGNGRSSSSSTLHRDSSFSATSFGDDSEQSQSFNMEDTLLTFSVGIAPISVDCDPVTQLSKLFQQGSPLCIIFNAVRPQNKLTVVSSDDMKICKKSIYDFILGLKQHFAFNDEELFTISDVFSNSTDHFLKVLDVVNTLLNAAPEIFPAISTDSLLEAQRLAKPQTEYDKIVKEFIETERKYVHDLEILNKYRKQLLDNQVINSEELYMLFPNLNDIIDFQRRFLVSLEVNGQVPPQKQRIGALFLHSKYFFKLYEPWSIGQNAAIDFISSSFDKISPGNTNFVIGNKMELQSFLLKPVQRLCRYPLLLKDLLENAESETKELELALSIAKSIARNINENQRRTENYEVVKRLYGRVVNWKGYRIAKFGELLYFDKISISTSSGNEPEKDFEVYLFEKIILLFSEVTQKKGSSISLKKKNNSSSMLHLPSSSNNNSNDFAKNSGKLDLRGRIMIVNLTQVTPIENHSLNIIWESTKEKGNFILKFKNEETRNNWENCLHQLLRQIRSESFKSINTNSDMSSMSSPVQYSHNSVASIGSTLTRQISEVLPKSHMSNARQSFASEYRSISENYKNSIPETMLLLRVSFNNDFYTVLVNLEFSADEVLQAIKKKLTHLGTITKVKYQDEDGDFVMLESDDDWYVVKDMLKESNERLLNVWAYTN